MIIMIDSFQNWQIKFNNSENYGLVRFIKMTAKQVKNELNSGFLTRLSEARYAEALSKILGLKIETDCPELPMLDDNVKIIYAIPRHEEGICEFDFQKIELIGKK